MYVRFRTDHFRHHQTLKSFFTTWWRKWSSPGRRSPERPQPRPRTGPRRTWCPSWPRRARPCPTTCSSSPRWVAVYLWAIIFFLRLFVCGVRRVVDDEAVALLSWAGVLGGVAIMYVVCAVHASPASISILPPFATASHLPLSLICLCLSLPLYRQPLQLQTTPSTHTLHVQSAYAVPAASVSK